MGWTEKTGPWWCCEVELGGLQRREKKGGGRRGWRREDGRWEARVCWGSSWGFKRGKGGGLGGGAVVEGGPRSRSVRDQEEEDDNDSFLHRRGTGQVGLRREDGPEGEKGGGEEWAREREGPDGGLEGFSFSVFEN
jgi:hypothetical protein